MIYYMCKYTPLELLAGFGAECARLEPSVDSFEMAESLGHANLCGYGKGFLEAAMEQGIEELVLVNCCDVVRRIYDILKHHKKYRFLHLMDLPHRSGKAQELLLKKELEHLAARYQAHSGRQFNREAAWKAVRSLAEQSGGNRDRPHLSLQGAHGGPHLYGEVKRHFPFPVTDDTCSGFRKLNWEGGPPATDGEFLERYSRALLRQFPCMRMQEAGDRSLSDRNVNGVIYHTMKFCDYYSFEYAAKKDRKELPLLKIETDGTRQSGGQLGTRLDAFAERLFPGASGGGRKRPRAGYTAGIDSGSASTDVAILGPDRELVSWAVVPTGAGAAAGAGRALSEALQKAGLEEKDLDRIISTGYGRDAIGKSDAAVTEITCHARGAHYLNPAARTVIDIGGQDSKVIRIDETGAVQNFVMNDKCAAGTGRFLEMMARTMELSMDEMDALGQKWKEEVTISSMCTVFAESEVVSLIARNTAPADIIHGLNLAVAARTAALVRRAGGGESCIMTGGVARNKGIVRALEEKLETAIWVSEYAQLCGAIGAALIAKDENINKGEQI